MTEQQLPARAELVALLRASGQEFVTRLSALPETEFAIGRYENGWNGRQILAHVASIEWTYPRLLDIGRQDAPDEAAGVPTRTAQGGIDAYNQRHVDRRARATVQDLLAEFQRNRETTIAAVEAADESLLNTPIRSAGGVTGPLAGVLRAVAVSHVLGHMRDILGNGSDAG